MMGVSLKVYELSPRLVRRLLRRAVVARQWQQVARAPGRAHLARGGMLEPPVRLTASGAMASGALPPGARWRRHA